MKPMVIVGSAPCAEADYTALLTDFPRLNPDRTLIGIDALWSWALPAEYIATYHTADIAGIRRAVGDGPIIISHKKFCNVGLIEPIDGPTGSSALLGVRAALRLGYERVILCGCPLTGRNGHNRDYFKQYSAGWKHRYTEIKPFVRSMSGWTKQLLGGPTHEWTNPKHNAAPTVRNRTSDQRTSHLVGERRDGRDRLLPGGVNRGLRQER